MELSYDSNFGRQNFGGRGQFSTSLVNGESVLQIIPSRFSLPLSFIALFISSISLFHSILLLKLCLACWLESLILLHFGFHLFANVLRFGIPLFSAFLHSSELVLPHWPKGLGFVVVAQHLAEMWPPLPSCTPRNSFVTGKDGFND